MIEIQNNFDFDLNFNIVNDKFLYNLFYHILETRNEYLLYFLKKIYSVQFLKNIETPKDIDVNVINKVLELRLQGYNKDAIIEKLNITNTNIYKNYIEMKKSLDIIDEEVMGRLLEEKLKKYYTSMYVSSLFDTLLTKYDTDSKLNKIEKEIKKYYSEIDFKTDFKETQLSNYETIINTENNTRFLNISFPSLNKVFKKGFETSRLYIIGGASGRGKSTLLHNLAIDLVKKGYIIYHFTLENSLDETLNRYISNISEIPLNELQDKKDIVKAKVNQFISSTTGKIYIKEYPVYSLSKEDILNYIKTKKLTDSVDPDVIIIDYLDLMNTYTKFNELRFKLSQIANDLKSIAQTTNTVVLTATQLNREAVRKTTSDEANVSEAYGKIHVADAFITLNSTKIERKRNLIRLYIAKNRVGESGKEYLFKIDFSIMKFVDLDTEVTESYLKSLKGETIEDTNFDLDIDIDPEI